MLTEHFVVCQDPNWFPRQKNKASVYVMSGLFNYDTAQDSLVQNYDLDDSVLFIFFNACVLFQVLNTSRVGYSRTGVYSISIQVKPIGYIYIYIALD